MFIVKCTENATNWKDVFEDLKERGVAVIDLLVCDGLPGIENVLALRGDMNPNIPVKHDFHYANELVEYIKTQGDFSISGGCYPEKHLEAPDAITDIRNLKRKVDAGVDHLVSQLFFDNEVFYDFYEKTRIAGIDVPIDAGVMPVTNRAQIERMVTMCGCSGRLDIR